MVELAEPTPVPVVKEEPGIVIESDEVEVIIVEETPLPSTSVPETTPAPIICALFGLVAVGLLVYAYRRRL